MAKYDWKQLEKEYILSDCKSVNAFLKSKGISRNKTSNTQTKEWNIKKHQRSIQKTSKIIEKVTEKESQKDAEKILQIKDVANELLKKIIKANSELNMHIAKNKKKTKTVEFDYTTNKPKKETTYEDEEIKSYIDIIDRQGLKMLTSALKDLNDIIAPKEEDNDEDNSFIEALKGKTEDVWDEEEK